MEPGLFEYLDEWKAELTAEHPGLAMPSDVAWNALKDRVMLVEKAYPRLLLNPSHDMHAILNELMQRGVPHIASWTPTKIELVPASKARPRLGTTLHTLHTLHTIRTPIALHALQARPGWARARMKLQLTVPKRQLIDPKTEPQQLTSVLGPFQLDTLVVRHLGSHRADGTDCGSSVAPLMIARGSSSPSLFTTSSLDSPGGGFFEFEAQAGATLAVVKGRLSRRSPLTISNNNKRAAGIPLHASSFAFAYPPKSGAAPDFTDDAASRFTQLGGFAYFSDNGDVASLSAMRTGGTGLLFSRPVKLGSLPVRAALEGAGRVQPPTIDYFINAGVKGFCWISPGEQVGEGTADKWPHGAFCYFYAATHSHFDCYYKVVQVEGLVDPSGTDGGGASLQKAPK